VNDLALFVTSLIVVLAWSVTVLLVMGLDASQRNTAR
jgi:hypothetical protein